MFKILQQRAFFAFTQTMSTAFSFQTQLTSIMDALSKTAVLEISKLVEIESKMLKIEITRGRNEIASLTEKLQLMEKLLYMAQGSNRQETTAAITVRGASESGQPDRTRPAINRESPRESITSSAEDSSLHQREEHTESVQLQDTKKEQPELIVIKEEPSDVEFGYSEDENPSESRQTVLQITGVQGGSDVVQCPKPVRPAPDCQQPTYNDSFINVNSQSSLSASKRSENEWNLHLPSACTKVETRKTLTQNATPSSNMARNAKIHNLRTSSAKKFCCLQCGKSFRCFSQLEIHQRSHTGEKPFRCTLCGKKYAQKGHLYTHQRTHTGEKPYQCPICGKGFIQKCTLDMHQRTHTGEKPFVCIQCGKGFTKNCNLKKHLAVHLDASLHLYGNESAPTFSGTFINRTT